MDMATKNNNPEIYLQNINIVLYYCIIKTYKIYKILLILYFHKNINFIHKFYLIHQLIE